MAIAEVMGNAGLPEPLADQMSTSGRVCASVEEDVEATRQAAVEPFAAAADDTDDLRSRWIGRDGGRHFTVGEVIDVLVDVVDDATVEHDQQNQKKYQAERGRLRGEFHDDGYFTPHRLPIAHGAYRSHGSADRASIILSCMI